MEQELSSSESDMQELDLLPGISVLLDEDGEIVHAGEEFAVLIGYSTDSMCGMHFADLVAENETGSVVEFIESILRSGSDSMDLQLVNKWGTSLSLFLKGKKIRIDRSLHIFIQGFEVSGTDLFKKGYQQGKREASREYEKEIGKIYHRVNNQLAVLSSLIDLKKSDVENPAIHHLLSKTQSRINTFAMLHESMYQSSRSHKVPVNLFILNLINAFEHTFDTKSDLEIKVSVDEFHLPIEKALPFALATNEILTNAIEHAFKNQKKGEIRVEVKTKKNKARVILSDNGIGMSEIEEKAESETIGLKLIRIYLKQLDAAWDVEVKRGVKYDIIFEIV